MFITSYPCQAQEGREYFRDLARHRIMLHWTVTPPHTHTHAVTVQASRPPPS